MYGSGRLARGHTLHCAGNPRLGQEGWHSVAQDIMPGTTPGNAASTAKNVSGSPHHETVNFFKERWYHRMHGGVSSQGDGTNLLYEMV